MRIPESKIAEIAASADIVQIISEYVTLKKAGKDFRGMCPFHGDKDPSFYVAPQKSIFHCFGCGVGGNIYSFLMRIENVSFIEAVKLVADRTGIVLEWRNDGRSPDDKQKILAVLNEAQRYFVRNLKAHAEAREYLSSREIAPEHFESVGFGFAPDLWEGLENHLRSSGADIKDALSAGLLKARQSGGHYDAFRSRITVPIKDLGGKIVAFGGRIFGEGDPKYLNSPESAVFHKKYVLYGLEAARDAIRREDEIIIVEGYFDQIALRIRGVENVVASMGTALGTEQIKLLKRFSSTILTIFDGDEAGLRAVKRSIPLFLSESVEPRCLILTEDKDPDEAIRRLGVEGFRKKVGEAVSMIDFFLETITRNHSLNTVQGRDVALEECIPVLREIADSKERDYLIERFSSALKIREDRLHSASSRRGSPTKAVAHRGGVNNLFAFPGDERNVVRGMLFKEGFIEQVTQSGLLKEIEHPILSTLAQEMATFQQNTGAFDPTAFALSLEDETMASLVAAWLKPRPEEDDLRPEVDGDIVIQESLNSLRLRKLAKRKTEIQEKMKTISAQDEDFKELAKELWIIGQYLRR